MKYGKNCILVTFSKLKMSPKLTKTLVAMIDDHKYMNKHNIISSQYIKMK